MMAANSTEPRPASTATGSGTGLQACDLSESSKPASIFSAIFGAVNSAIAPLARAGLAPPLPCPQSLIVLETRGRKTGRVRSVPLVAVNVGDAAVVATIRGKRSHWVKNAAHNQGVRYWQFGCVREATALVLAPGMEAPPDRLPLLVQMAATGLLPLVQTLGFAFVVLVPRRLRPA